MSDLIIVDDSAQVVMESVLGVDLNHLAFRHLYADFAEQMETSNHIAEDVFFRVLHKEKAILKDGTRHWPPAEIYDRMKGRSGEIKVGFYCKKHSKRKDVYIESYGICLDQKDAFYKRFGAAILKSMIEIEDAVDLSWERIDRMEREELSFAKPGETGEIRALYNIMRRERKHRIINKLLG